MIPNKWVIIWDGQPIGLDSNSGGYPYKTMEPNSIKYWESKKVAEDYMGMFQHNWSVHEVQFRLMN